MMVVILDNVPAGAHAIGASRGLLLTCTYKAYSFLLNQRGDMPNVVPELTDHLGYWLRQVSNHVSHAFARKLMSKDVTVAEWALLRSLYDRPPTAPSGIADAMGLTRGAVSKLADRLVDKALISRAASPTDGRAHTLSLTAAGAALVPELAALADENEVECFAQLSIGDRNELARVLKDIVSRLSITATPMN